MKRRRFSKWMSLLVAAGCRTQHEPFLGEEKMDIQQGEHVLVNLAPFIGSLRHSNESIPCDVLAIDGTLVEVETKEPCRRFSLWVASTWIDGRIDPSHRQLASV